MLTQNWHKKTCIAVWRHIDFLKVNLAFFFCSPALYHIKMTRISMQDTFYLVNMTYLVAPPAGEHPVVA